MSKALKYSLITLLFLINIFGTIAILLTLGRPSHLLGQEALICDTIPNVLRIIALIFFIFSSLKFKKIKLAFSLSIVAALLFIGSLSTHSLCNYE